MQAIAQNTPSSFGYIKCGEILKSQKSFQDSYLLQCMQCKEIYLLLESFIFHLDATCQRTVENNNKNIRESIDSNTNDDEVANESLNCDLEQPSVKLENSSLQMDDPLIVVKSEVCIEKSSIKEEPKLTEESEESEESPYNTEQLENSNSEENEEKDDVETPCINLDECKREVKSENKVVKIVQKPTYSNLPSSSFVSNFIKSRTNVSSLIAAFKDQPQLWNKNMPNYGHKLKRRENMEKIARDLNQKHKLNINGSQVSSVVLYLCRKYQDYLQKSQEKVDNEKQKHISHWYLNELNFIRPFLENYSLETLDVNQPTLNTDQILQVLEIYRNLPHLWNTSLIENHCKNKRHESILEMLKQLEENMNIKISENVLEQYIRTIHNNFSREKKRNLNNKNSNKTSTSENCNNYYERLMFLYDHVPPLRCTVCGGDSISPLHFKMHKSTHDGTLPFTCSQCNRTFKRVNVYISHAKRHLEDLNHICKECGKKFVNYTNLRLHMRIHTGDKPYCCEMCGESFRFLQTLSNHRRRHEKRYLHTCKLCSQGFYSKMRHDDHMNSHMNIRSYICDICNKAFITKRALQQHKVVHEDVRRFACKLCGKTFKHKTGVNQHMKTHDIATNEDRNIT